MIPKIDFKYEANKSRVSKKASYNIWKGLLLAIFTGFAIAVVLIFVMIPGAAQAFDDISTGMSTIYIILLVITAATVGGLIVRDGYVRSRKHRIK